MSLEAGACAGWYEAVAGNYNRVFGADAHFQFYQRLEFDMYLLGSKTPGLSGANQGRRFQALWRDDELTISGEYNAVQTNFNPELGFVRRGDVSRQAGQVSWAPRFERSDTIRNLTFGTSVDYYESASTGAVETRTQDATGGITFHASSRSWRRAARRGPRSAVRPPEPGFATSTQVTSGIRTQGGRA
jgi:hypothetical protein